MTICISKRIFDIINPAVNGWVFYKVGTPEAEINVKFDKLIAEEQAKAKYESSQKKELTPEERKCLEEQHLRVQYADKVKEYLTELKDIFPKIVKWDTAYEVVGIFNRRKELKVLHLSSCDPEYHIPGAGLVVISDGRYCNGTLNGFVTPNNLSTLDEFAKKVVQFLPWNQYKYGLSYGRCGPSSKETAQEMLAGNIYRAV